MMTAIAGLGSFIVMMEATHHAITKQPFALRGSHQIWWFCAFGWFGIFSFVVWSAIR